MSPSKFFKAKPIYAIFLVIFIDFFTIGLTYPTLAILIKEEGAGNLLPSSYTQLQRDQIYALLSGLFFFCTFFGAPVLGVLADRWGRKRVLMMTSTLSGIGFLIMGIGAIERILPLLFAGRMLSGLLGSIMLVVLSSLADISSEKDKANNFGLPGVAFGGGFMLGIAFSERIIGSGLNEAEAFTFLAAGGFLLINTLFVISLYPETLEHFRKDIPVRWSTGIRNVYRAFSDAAWRRLFTIIFLTTLGFSTFVQMFPVFLLNRFPEVNNDKSIFVFLLAYAAIWAAISQGILIRIVSKWLRPARILYISLPAFAICYLLLLVPENYYWMYVVIPLITIFQGLTYPCLLAILSNRIAPDMQGEIVGMDQSVKALGSSFPILLTLSIVDISWLAVLIGCAATVAAFSLYIYARRREAFA